MEGWLASLSDVAEPQLVPPRNTRSTRKTGYIGCTSESAGPGGSMKSASTVLASFLIVVFAVTIPAEAQIGYFGQKKVQYQSFKFQVLKTDHFDVYYYPQEEAAARMAGRMAERWYARLSSVLAHELNGRQSLVLYASGSQFRQTNVVEGELGEGTGGVTEAYKRRIVLPFAGPLEATDHVLG